MHRGKSFKIHEQSDSDCRILSSCRPYKQLKSRRRERVGSKKKIFEKRNGYFSKFDENNIKFGEQYGDPLKN